MILFRSTVLFGVLLGACSPTQDDATLQGIVLAALRVSPLDSLTFGACQRLEIDPDVRAFGQPNSIFLLDSPMALKVTFPADSLHTRLPVVCRHYDATEGVGSGAQILVGIYLPKGPRGDTTSLTVGVGGCRLAGSLVRVQGWREGQGFNARVRGIHEG